MATRIRLQRGGRKNSAFYSIVIADVRAPRDGKFTEKIGTYNPNTNPATVDLNFDRALYWVECGAQPTDTVRNILKGEGVYMMKHLRGGVKKGAFDESAVQAKFDAWKAGKDQKNNAVKESVAKAKKDAAAKKYLEDINAAKTTFESTGDWRKYDADVEKAAEERDKAIENAKREIYGDDYWRY